MVVAYRLLFGELEVSPILFIVVQLHHELPAGAGPGPVRLPDVVVLACRGVVGEAARACSEGLSIASTGAVELHVVTADFG